MSQDAVAAVGLRLFLRDGFEQTTMSQVAEEAGIGRKTLFAYFPCKADIVWNRFRRQVQDLTASLEQAPEKMRATDAVVAAVMRGLHMDPENVPIMRSELELIADNPSLQAYAHLEGRPWRETITRFLAQRSGQRPDGVLPQVVGHGYWHAMFVGFDRWLESEDPLPQEHVRAALTEYAKAVKAAFGPARRS